jgi:N-acetyl-gamma-glutamyl-phosphate reductase
MNIGEVFMTKVFIDGSVGTTGLQIQERLSARRDVSLLTLPEARRKDPETRREALNGCDIAFLCLPDGAAREAAAMVTEPKVKIIDASTAHRTAPGWVYGFPELFPGRRAEIAAAKRVANPGCHASGFVALAVPLLRAGLLSADAVLCCHSLTGYSGGGKAMIAEYEAEERSGRLDAPRLYALGQQHKHLPEMTVIPGLRTPPVFTPVVAPFYKGMLVILPLHGTQLRGGIEGLREVYKNAYAGPVVRYMDGGGESLLSAGGLAGSDGMEISVWGTDERMTAVARFDNLGKGASGSAVQCMNLLMGADETAGLSL